MCWSSKKIRSCFIYEIRKKSEIDEDGNIGGGDGGERAERKRLARCVCVSEVDLVLIQIIGGSSYYPYTHTSPYPARCSMGKS